jgi:hypothetical protein
VGFGAVQYRSGDAGADETYGDGDDSDVSGVVLFSRKM